MSSWVGDWWERGVITTKNGDAGRYRTECKLGRHPIFQATPARWVKDSRLAPLGLSCVECLSERARELGLGVPAEPVTAKVPAPARTGRPRKAPEELVHGRAATYSRHKCRCVPCTEANSARSMEYRQRRRAAA